MEQLGISEMPNSKKHPSHLKQFIKIFTKILYKVHVRDARKNQVSSLLREGNLCLRKPSPMKGI